MYRRTVKLISRLNSKTVLSRTLAGGNKISLTKLFFRDDIQKLLQRMIVYDIDKVFEPKKLGQPQKGPTYKFMTTKELEEEMSKYHKKAEHFLQIPPVMDARKEINEILSVDPEIDGFDVNHAKFIFTDVSEKVPSRDRPIVVREPNGILRQADWDERFRMTQIFSPIANREYKTPKMFEEKYLEDLLNRCEYQFILDAACCQFEPDDPEYIKIISRTYMRICETSHFIFIHKTRHMGSYAFYSVVNKKVDTLLLFYIHENRLEKAIDVVHLYHKIHPNCASAFSSYATDLDKLKQLIELDCGDQKHAVQAALQGLLSGKSKSESRNISVAENY